MSNPAPGDVEVRYLFPTPVMTATLANAAALNAQLKDVILRRKEASSGVIRSNIHGWHSDTEMLRWGGEAAKALALETLQICAGRVEDVAMRNNVPRYEFGMEMWANVSPPGSSNHAHTHPGSLWSAVYYVDDGGDPDASLVLIDPNYPMNRMYAPDLQFVGKAGERFPTNEMIAPAPGRLVIFPSWLQHSVKPAKGPRDRISIAMNMMAIPLRPGPAQA
ncbi:MAG: TIGR02466 family protein [Parvularculaceae bacterium]